MMESGWRWIARTTILCLSVFTASTPLTLAAELNADRNTGLCYPSHWTTLTPSRFIGQAQQIPFFRLKTKNGSIAYAAVINLKDRSVRLRPFFNQKTGTTSDAASRNNASLAINGGYFNLSDAQSAGYVVIDGKSQCDPKTNKALVGNPKLKAYLPTIFNRSELRVLRNQKGETRVDIRKHNDPVPAGWLLDSSVQAGPQLLPELTATKEAFLRTNPDGSLADSIGSRRPAARTACGTTGDGHLILLCVASKNQEEFSSGATLEEVADILKQLGCDHAINFDGGTSTTMAIACGKEDLLASSPLCTVKKVCGQSPEKYVKSGLMVLTKSGN